MVQLNTVSFKTFAPAQEAKPVAPLGPLVGQYGLNLMQFCTEVNKLTYDYSKGVPLPIYVEKSPAYANGYKINIKPPTLSFLFSVKFISLEEEFFNIRSKIDICDLYDVVSVYSYFHKLAIADGAKEVFAYLKSIKGPLHIKNNNL